MFLTVLTRLDGCCVGTVAQAEHCRDDKQQLDAQSLPDPAAEERNKNRNGVINRHPVEMVAFTSSSLSARSCTYTLAAMVAREITESST